jgi:hypothetical protein
MKKFFVAFEPLPSAAHLHLVALVRWGLRPVAGSAIPEAWTYGPDDTKLNSYVVEMPPELAGEFKKATSAATVVELP